MKVVISNCSQKETEVPHISDRNEIRKIMIYDNAECVHTKKSSRTQIKESGVEVFFPVLLRPLFCRARGFCCSFFRFLLINSLLKQGGTVSILKLLWCLGLFWFCFYTSNDLWNRLIWVNSAKRKVCKCRIKSMSKWLFNEITIDKSWSICGVALFVYMENALWLFKPFLS
jgi:hypothetical protein